VQKEPQGDSRAAKRARLSAEATDTVDRARSFRAALGLSDTEVIELVRRARDAARAAAAAKGGKVNVSLAVALALTGLPRRVTSGCREVTTVDVAVARNRMRREARGGYDVRSHLIGRIHGELIPAGWVKATTA
jgi:hypothetical protein